MKAKLCLLLIIAFPSRQRGSAAGKSKSIPMPRAPQPGPSAAMLQQAAYEVLQKCADAFPCNNLGLTATEFQVHHQAVGVIKSLYLSLMPSPYCP